MQLQRDVQHGSASICVRCWRGDRAAIARIVFEVDAADRLSVAADDESMARAERLANSNDLVGMAIYAGEGPIGFRARWLRDNEYQAEYQWGGVDAPWNPGGVWRIGGRQNQRIAAIDVTSPDQGARLVGQVQYIGERPIGFRGMTQP